MAVHVLGRTLEILSFSFSLSLTVSISAQKHRTFHHHEILQDKDYVLLLFLLSEPQSTMRKIVFVQ